MKGQSIVFEFWTKEAIEGTAGGVGTMLLALLIDAQILFVLGALGTVSLWVLNVWHVVLKIKNQNKERKDRDSEKTKNQ